MGKKHAFLGDLEELSKLIKDAGGNSADWGALFHQEERKQLVKAAWDEVSAPEMTKRSKQSEMLTIFVFAGDCCYHGSLLGDPALASGPSQTIEDHPQADFGVVAKYDRGYGRTGSFGQGVRR